MRSVYVRTDCGCSMPGIEKLLDAEIRLQKGRRPVHRTRVARYVEGREQDLAKALLAILRQHAQAIAGPIAQAAVAAQKIDQEKIAALLQLANSSGLSAALVEALKAQLIEAFNDGGSDGVDQVAGLSAGETDGDGTVGSVAEITDQVDAEAVFYAANRGGELIKDLAGTTDEDLRELLSNSIDEGISHTDLADKIGELGAFGEARASTIARTELAFAYVQGNVEGWRATGQVDRKQWILGDMHDIDDECDDAADAGTVDLDDDFGDTGVDFPPAHPNAVLEGSSFAAYGHTLQLVRAMYSGPAITLKTDGIDLTIGPNHPVLTQRGFVAAKNIHEGDELLYDVFAQEPARLAVKSDLKNVVRLEVVFPSLLLLSRVHLASAAGYFHDDIVDGEVDVVRPDSGLLPVLDPSGIEHFCKDALMRADMTEESLIGLGAQELSLWAIDGSAPSQVSFGCDGLPLLECHAGIARFHRCRVTSTHEISFQGYAFDASTTTRLYNSGGFVVKNCICDVLPVLADDTSGGDE